MPSYAKRSEPFEGAGRPEPEAAAEPGTLHRDEPPAPEPPLPTPPSGGAELWTMAELVLRRWYWLALATVLLGAAGFLAGQRFFQSGYTASVRLLRFGADNATEFYKPRQFTEDTFAGLLKAPELLERVSSLARPRLTPDQLAARLAIAPARESDVVEISLKGPLPQVAVDWANLFADEVVRHTKELQKQEAAEVNEALKGQLTKMNADLERLNKQLHALPRLGLQPGARASPLAERLQKARDELLTLLARYTDRHPLVSEKRAEIAVLEQQLKEVERSAAAERSDPAKPADPDQELIRSQLQAIANNHLLLAQRQREAQWFVDSPPGYCRIFAPAALKGVVASGRQMKVLFLTAVGGLLGFGCALLSLLVVEVMDDRIKTVADVKRVTRLPLLATLGDIHRLSPAAQTHWAFRTWTALQNRFSLSPNHGMVCGVISAGPGEGRSTWINLLAQAAGQCGFRVLTIGTVRTSVPDDEAEPLEVVAEHGNGASRSSTALTTNVLSAPAQVTRKLTGEDPQPFVHIPLPGWVWNLERRKQWQAALGQWRRIENVVILVELPPATQPESVLLATNLPNLIWLARSGHAHAGETRSALQTLRDARCNLVGAVLNGQSAPSLQRHFARWIGGWLLFAGLAGGGIDSAAQTPGTTAPPPPVVPAPSTAPAPAADPAPPPFAGAPAEDQRLSVTNFSFSALDPAHRSEWQKRLTLGPGDVLNLALFGQPELDRREVAIGPDGRISFLQVQDLMAAGLTVDELRARFDEELAKFYRTPRTLITPAAFRSKKYYVLGKVVSQGVFTMERPVSIVEAVARAQGLETGLLDGQNVQELADLQRSFLARQGQRVPVNFEKLFLEGDLSQNVPLEPDDYLYFAAGAVKEVYVLGEVNVPGPVNFTANTTVLTAIAQRSGFTARAFKSRVLVVRGSLSKPEKFVVDTWAALDARGMDFKLQPKDIVYVHNRPFVRIEELADLAATAFIQAVVTAWTGRNIGPVITSPILPNL